MADCSKAKIPPFDPDSLPSDAKWVPMLDAQDQFDYWSAPNAFDAVKVKYESAVRVAQATLEQVNTDFQTLKDNWSTAEGDRDEAIQAAEGGRGTLAGLVQGLDPAAGTDPAAAKRQIAELQKGAEAYGNLLKDVAPKETALATALDILKKASEPQPSGFDPSQATINSDRLNLAEAQFQMAKETARKPYTAGWDVLLQKRAVLYSHLDDQVPDSELKAQSR